MEKKYQREINIQMVKIEDQFWHNYQNLIIDQVIPYQEKILRDEIPGVEKSHAIENFRIAAGLSEGEFYGMAFQDSDVAKWLEGVAYALVVKPDQELEKKADDIIDIIAQAQQEDGYLNTYFTIKDQERRWTNLHECHELYCAGHMMEAAVAYYEATGKDKLLKVMERMADHIANRFGEDKEHGIPGHQEIEIGLMRLYHVTGKESYKELARFFLEERGKNPDFFKEEYEKRGYRITDDMDPYNNKYNQTHATIYEQNEAVGHSVRAVYMYTAMADLANEDNDERLSKACERLWNNIVNKKMYLTGAIGATVEGEAFSINYDLPNDTIYGETCAAIGLVFFARQMLKLQQNGAIADVMERALYNGIISGMQLDGKRFFYVNPLEVNPGISGELYGHRHVLPERPEWYACACCPPNVVRLLTSLGKYAWDESEDAIYSHLFIGQNAELDKADFHVQSKYPWEGSVVYTLEQVRQPKFKLAIHIPAYIKELNILLNGVPLQVEKYLENGYVYLERNWKKGDQIELVFDMPVRKIYANQKVKEDAGCVALMRGPIVYCFEEADNGGLLQSLRIPADLKAVAQWCQKGKLSGMMLLKFSGIRVSGGESLYSEEPPKKEVAQLTAVPYYTWGNRGLGQMRVWMLEE